MTLVLNYLTGKPFEPINQSSLLNLTLKTLFLLKLASVRRRGKLYALSTHPECIQFRPGLKSVLLLTEPGCVAKNCKPTKTIEEVGVKPQTRLRKRFLGRARRLRWGANIPRRWSPYQDPPVFSNYLPHWTSETWGTLVLQDCASIPQAQYEDPEVKIVLAWVKRATWPENDTGSEKLHCPPETTYITILEGILNMKLGQIQYQIWDTMHLDHPI